MLLSLLLLSTSSAQDFPPPPKKAGMASIYDGDTFTLDTGDKVRLAGVNTPELKPAEDYGVEAREAAEAFLSGKELTLIYGVTERDGYGRLISWVEVDGQPLSVHLVERGLGHVFLIPPSDTADQAALLAAQEAARKAKRGIWSTESYSGSFHFTSFHANAAGDDRENVNGEYLRLCNITTQPQSLDGYRITDHTGASWSLPALIVPAGHTVKIHSGQGSLQADPTSQLAIFLGSPTPIWNNQEDRATLYDRYDAVVDTRLHSVHKATP